MADRSRSGCRSCRAVGLFAGLCLMALCVLAPLAEAQSPNRLDAAATKVEALAAAGKLDAAIALANRLVGSARKSLRKTDPKLAAYITELASLYDQAGKLGPAEKLAREAVRLAERGSDRDSEGLAASLSGLATVLIHAGKLEEADSALARALALAEDTQGPGSAEVVDLQRRLASLYDLQGRKAEADSLRQRLAAAEQNNAEEAKGAATEANQGTGEQSSGGGFPDMTEQAAPEPKPEPEPQPCEPAYRQSI